MNRIITICVTMLLLVSPLFATGQGEADSEDMGGDQEQIELTYWGHGHPPMVEFVTETLIPEYEAANPNVTVNFEPQGFGAEFDQKVITALVSGEGPDIIATGGWNVPAFIQRNFISPLIPEAFGVDSPAGVRDLYLPNALSGFSADDTIYGVPMEFNTFLLYYRTDHFREAGLDPNDPPTTWKEVGEMAQALTQRNASGQMTRAGFQWSYNRANTYMPQFEPLVLQAGTTLLDMDNDAGRKAVDTWYSMIRDYEVSDPGFQLHRWEDFWNGLQSMVVSGPFYPGFSANYPDVNHGENWRAARLPQMEDGEQEATILYGWAWVVPTNSDEARAAWDFISFMTSKQKEWFQNVNYIQPRKGWIDDEIRESAPWLDVVLEDMAIGVPQLPNENFAEIRAEVANMLERVAMEGVSIEESVRVYQQNVDRILGR